MIYIETGSTDVYYNFALEYYFTLEKRLPETVFLFWRTTPTLMVASTRMCWRRSTRSTPMLTAFIWCAA